MLTIDGSQGEGGGQVLRSSLALSLVTGEPFRIENVRARRAKPGLMRQHLTALNAAAEISRAEVIGAAIGAREVTFRPGRARGGSYSFSVGTAGSATLVLQTVLPALMLAGEPSALILEGGTHNPRSPPFEFLARAFLPLLRRMGPRVDAVLEKPGFYPAGGGRIRAAISPVAALRRIDLLERGEIRSLQGKAVVAALPESIADREIRVLAEKLGWDRSRLRKETTRNSRGPGNAVIVEIECENVTEVLPFALAGGGSYRTMPPTLHTRTQVEVLRTFLGSETRLKAETDSVWLIEIPSYPHSHP
jgi:RNA 3'-terminal phosphate cyclase (ATP)